MGYRSDLVCEVSALSYDFETQTGKLDMAPSQCCDMAGCVELFEKIDADVRPLPATSRRSMPEFWRLAELSTFPGVG
jgi:hypothetical protein